MKRLSNIFFFVILCLVVPGCKHSETTTAQLTKAEMQQVSSSATIASLLVSQELTRHISLDSIHFDFLINDPDIRNNDGKDKNRVRGRISAYGVSNMESDKRTLDKNIDSSYIKFNKKELLDSLFKYKDIKVNKVDNDDLQGAAIVGSIFVIILILYKFFVHKMEK